PGGQIIRIQPDGVALPICTTSERYVWALAVDATGTNLFAGTGPRGRIYSLTKEGKASIYYSTKQDHVLSLAVDAHGTLFAGTDKNGLIYRLDGPSKGFVLFHAPQSEIRKLFWTDRGLYAGTSAPRRGSPGASVTLGR